MPPADRRSFLKLLGSAALGTTFAKSIEKAVAVPAHYRTGTIEDVEHVVFLMQENRAFDHYFGTLRGVRGYGDTRPAMLPNGKPVWFQPDGAGHLLPFHPSANNLGMQFLEDTPHRHRFGLHHQRLDHRRAPRRHVRPIERPLPWTWCFERDR